MLKMTPPEIITFTKSDTGELVGSVDVQNVVKYPVTYKVCTILPCFVGRIECGKPSIKPDTLLVCWMIHCVV